MTANSSEQRSATALSSAIQHAVAQAATSVVRIASRRGHATSGTVWSADGLILTTHRGTARARELRLLDYRERELKLELVGRDPGSDLVLLRAPGGAEAGLEPITRASSEALPQTGALSVALARPGRQIRASLRAVGVVGPSFRTPRGARIDAWLETDRALPRGFSGGPLIDTHGHMIGLDSRGLVRRADLAIPLTTIERVVAQLSEHGAVQQGWLGLSLVPVELDAHPRAALVAGLAPRGPALAAGVCIGDIITHIDGRPLEGPGGLRGALRGRSGQQLSLSLLRGGQPQSVELTPSEAP